ncbi:MAG: hypothetical protein ACKO9Q_25820 [Pirellula sp.]
MDFHKRYSSVSRLSRRVYDDLIGDIRERRFELDTLDRISNRKDDRVDSYILI